MHMLDKMNIGSDKPRWKRGRHVRDNSRARGVRVRALDGRTLCPVGVLGA